MARGGKRPGAGRKSGAKNKLTVEREKATQEAAAKIEAAIPDAFNGDSLQLLQAIYKDPKHLLATRMDAAARALPFEKPRLQALVPDAGRGDDDVPLHERLKAYAREEAIEASGGKVVEMPKKRAVKAAATAPARAAGRTRSPGRAPSRS